MGDGGIFFNDGFMPYNENGVEFMGEEFLSFKTLDNATTNYTNLQNVMALVYLRKIANGSTSYKLLIDNTAKIYSKAQTTGIYSGEIHTITGTASSRPDLIQAKSGNVFYTSDKYIGVGYRGKVTGGSTTTLVDSTTNFASLITPLGAELLTVAGWTSTDWTGGFVAGWTHTPGNTTALSHTLAAVSGKKYKIEYTVTGATAGTFTITFGSQTISNISATGNQDITASSTNNFVVTPTSDFDGTVILSVMKYDDLTTGRNKVTNMRTGIEYTITSISGAGNTTLNFTASGTNTNTADDDYIVWYDDKFDLSTTVPLPQFKGQTSTYNSLVRQIKEYGDEYYITNGNYLAKIASDEITFESDYKPLPARHEALSIAVNSDKILISTRKDNQPYLLYWDGYSDGLNNIMAVDFSINAITPYKNVFAYVSNGILYATDGWQLQIISKMADNRIMSPNTAVNPAYHNAITYYNNHIFIGQTTGLIGGRSEGGVYCYSPDYGWSYIQIRKNTKLGSNPCYCIYYNPFLFNNIEYGGEKTFGTINTPGNSTTNTDNKSFIYFVKLPKPTQIDFIELNLSNYYKLPEDYYNAGSYIENSASKITISLGDGNRGIFSYNQAESTTASKMEVDGTTRPGTVGDEVFIMDGDRSGERTFITGITNPGLATEQWSISPALTGVYASTTNLKIIKVRKCEEKTISIDNLNEPIKFMCDGFRSDKLFIEVVVHGINTSFPISISEMKIYGK